MKLETTSTSSAGLSPSLETLNPRYAQAEDEDQIVEWAEDFFNASPYQGVSFDQTAVRALFNHLISSGLGVVLMHESGFIAGSLTPLYFSPGIKIATEVAWWAPERGGRELREAFELWAQLNGAQAVQMSTFNDTNGPGLAKNLTDNGYNPVEVAYLKAI
jgi:hypothetical protein